MSKLTATKIATIEIKPCPNCMSNMRLVTHLPRYRDWYCKICEEFYLDVDTCRRIVGRPTLPALTINAQEYAPVLPAPKKYLAVLPDGSTRVEDAPASEAERGQRAAKKALVRIATKQPNTFKFSVVRTYTMHNPDVLQYWKRRVSHKEYWLYDDQNDAVFMPIEGVENAPYSGIIERKFDGKGKTERIVTYLVWVRTGGIIADKCV